MNRVETGFHRIGLLLVALGAILAIGLAGIVVYVFFLDYQGYKLLTGLGFSVGIFLVSCVAYGLCRALGWVASGFMGK